MQYGRDLLSAAAGKQWDSCSEEASTATASSELAALDLKYKALQETVTSQTKQIELLTQKLQESAATIEVLKQAKETLKAEVPEPEPKPAEHEDAASAAEGAREVSVAAARARLRRVCERKSDGTCQVPQEIQDAWQKGGQSRDHLLKVFIANGLDKSAFLRQISHETTKTKALKLSVTGDFYTEDEMTEDLKLSKCLGPSIQCTVL